jgi:hypothetical protein
VRSTDPGPPYEVRWHPDATAERDASWPPDEKVAMFHAVEKLVAAGAQLRFPHSSGVQGSVAKGMRELRPRRGSSRWHPIYRQVTPDPFVILAVAPEAQIDQAGAGGRRATPGRGCLSADGGGEHVDEPQHAAERPAPAVRRRSRAGSAVSSFSGA